MAAVGAAIAGVFVAGLLTQAEEEQAHQHHDAAARFRESMSLIAVNVCAAARRESHAEASSIFQQKVHAPLHVLAEQVADKDRGTAARLLHDKHRVETHIKKGSAGPELSESLYALAESTGAALRLMALPAAACTPPDPQKATMGT